MIQAVSSFFFFFFFFFSLPFLLSAKIPHYCLDVTTDVTSLEAAIDGSSEQHVSSNNNTAGSADRPAAETLLFDDSFLADFEWAMGCDDGIFSSPDPYAGAAALPSIP